MLNVEYFNKLKTSDMGKIIFRGRDELGNPVYTVGHGASKVVVPAMKHLAEILQQQYQNNEKIIFFEYITNCTVTNDIRGLIFKKVTY
ncbi:DUF3189 family protein [Bacillus cytotoxicus]